MKSKSFADRALCLILSSAMAAIPAHGQNLTMIDNFRLFYGENPATYVGEAEAAMKASSMAMADVGAKQAVAEPLRDSSCSSNNYSGCVFYGGVAIMAILMLLQLSKSKDQADYAKRETTHSEGDKAPPTYTPPTDPAVSVNTIPENQKSPTTKKAEKALAALEKKGFKYDPKTKKMSFPGGKTATVSTLMDLKKASGISDKEFAAFKNKAAQAAEEAKKKVAAAADGADGSGDGPGGGGGSSAGRGMASADGLPTMGALALGADGMGKGGGADIASLSKQYGDSKIGVGPSNIFTNLRNRYEVHQRNGSFLAP